MPFDDHDWLARGTNGGLNLLEKVERVARNFALIHREVYLLETDHKAISLTIHFRFIFIEKSPNTLELFFIFLSPFVRIQNISLICF